MRLYHGSTIDISKIDLALSKPEHGCEAFLPVGWKT